jgi:biotin-dependent carboxylase-like uncharacterized protein
MIEVLTPGITTIQDAGRKGLEQFGMPRSGALDPFLARLANRIAGNHLDAPLLEFALLGPTLRFLQPCSFVVAAFSSRYLLNEKLVAEFELINVTAGSVLRFQQMEGWFGYLAFTGGIQAEKILGSASTYVPGKIGKRIAAKDQINLHAQTQPKFFSKAGFEFPKASNILKILDATHTNLFHTSSKKLICENEYTILAQSDRMGIRLEGTPLQVPEVRRSIPALPGVIQVSRSGQLIILGPEGPVTGGYPQIAILSQTSWTTLARTRPGKKIRFEWITLEKARDLKIKHEQIFNEK